jgi:hypothetical protein
MERMQVRASSENAARGRFKKHGKPACFLETATACIEGVCLYANLRESSARRCEAIVHLTDPGSSDLMAWQFGRSI